VTEPERHAVLVSSKEVARDLRAGKLEFTVEAEPRWGHPRLVVVVVRRVERP